MFGYGKPVRGDDFFDRSVMKKDIINFITSGTDFMIKAPRRYGKTSLILEVLDRQHIYIDFRRVPRLSLISEEIINQAYELLGIKKFFLRAQDNVLSLIKEVKLSGKIDLTLVEFGAEIVIGNNKVTSDCEKMINSLKIANKIGASLNKKITIVYDEFQDIKRLACDDGDILEILRGTLQHEEFLHSVFLGSIESIMTDIFENKKSPFFNYCRKMNLQPFDIEELNLEIIESFRKKRMVFEKDTTLITTLEKLGGHPANTMLTLQTLYFLMLDSKSYLISEENINEAFERAYHEQLDLITEYISEMKTKKNYHDVMYRSARNEEQVISSQALYQVRQGLIEMGLLIQKDRDSYVITDSFLEEYLLR